MDDALLPQMHIFAEPLRERCCVRCQWWTGCCCELARSGVDARAELRLGAPHLGQQGHGIERAIKLSKTPFDDLAQFRMRQCARIGRGRNMIALDHFRALASLVLQLEGRLEEVGMQPRCGIQAFQYACRLDAIEATVSHKSPAIILPDADLDLAIAGAASAIFFNHGQCCCAGSRLFAHKSVYDRVVAGVADIAGKIKVGLGLDPSTEMGPLVSEEQFARVTGYIKDGRESGAKIAVGGDRVGNLGYFVAPTVFENTKPDMKIITEEIFGPVVCAQPFDDDDIDQANDTIYGLAASVWTRNGGTAHKLASRIRSGTVWINCHNVFDASLPFGGYKQSGWGREMGEEVLHN
jgi:Aldehyde dehydrogenase family